MTVAWDTSYEEGRDYKVMNLLLLERILTAVNLRTGSALDLGCGTGDLAIKLAEHGFKVRGIDGSGPALRQANKRAMLQHRGGSTRFQLMDLETDLYGSDEEHYDLIFCKLVLPFIQDKPRFLSWIKAHLSTKGAFVLIVPVLADGVPHSEHTMSISMREQTLDELFREAGLSAYKLHREYWGETGEEITYLLH